jgi:DNA-binding Lrp family transcriptional regulator
MDKIDRRILHELQREGRLTNADLAARVGLTATPCLRRVKRLEAIGAIRGYRALLDGDYLGCGFESYVAIVMRQEDCSTMSKFEEQVASIPEVVEAHRLFGDPDYLLRVAVADISPYERLYADILASLPGIKRLTTHLMMKAVKVNQGFPTGV